MDMEKRHLHRKLISLTIIIVIVLSVCKQQVLSQGISSPRHFPVLGHGFNGLLPVSSDSARDRISNLLKLSSNSEFSSTASTLSLLQSIIPQYISNLLKNETAKEDMLDKIGNIFQNDGDDPPLPCLNHFRFFFETLGEILTNLTAITDPKNLWALHMIDSWGHFPTEGILSGHVNSYGDYDECVGVSVDGPESDDDDFDGQYCWVYLVPSVVLDDEGSYSDTGNDNVIGVKKAGSVPDLVYDMLHPTGTFVLPSNAYCVPSTCSMEVIQELLTIVFGQVFKNLIPFSSFCRVKESKSLDTGAKVMIGVLSALACIILIGSVLDVVLESKKKFKDLKKKTHIRLLLAFSLPTNVRKWANTSSGEGGFGCIHGIRFFSTCWVLLAHTIFVIPMQGPSYNSTDVNNIYKKPWFFYIILNGFFSVDTFFTMSGLLACYTILKALDKSKGSINIPMLYLHRFLRLTPTYALIIGVLANLYKYLATGPFFTQTAENIQNSCRKHWWHNLLYFNNVYFYDGLKPEGMCEGESWYIANDMQFFLLSPIFAFLLWKWSPIGMGFLGAASLASILAPGIVVGTEKLTPTPVFWKSGPSPNPPIFNVYYHPWHRIGPYLVGMWMGYLLFKLSKRSTPVKLPKMGVIGGWLLSTATASAILFGVIPYYDPLNDDDYVAAGIYGGLSRFCWGIVIWVIFACVKGYGGWINEFLSWKAFIPLGRLTFCVYLSSLSVQYMLQLTLRQPMSFDMYHVTNMFFSHVIMCFLVGFVLSMTFESPFIALEKVIFGRSQEKQPAQEIRQPISGGFITTTTPTTSKRNDNQHDASNSGPLFAYNPHVTNVSNIPIRIKSLNENYGFSDPDHNKLS